LNISLDVNRFVLPVKLFGFITSCYLPHILSVSQGAQAVEGLVLKLAANAKCFSTKALENMKKLRLLQLSGVQLDGYFKYLSRNLRWLCWNEFPLTFMPTNFYQNNLVSIQLENSNIKFLWKEMQVLIELNFLHFMNCFQFSFLRRQFSSGSQPF